MSAPESPQHGLLFDLPAIDEEMRRESAYLSDGHTARTLMRAPDLRIVLFAMRSGSRIEKHRVNGSASLQVVAGLLRLHLPDRTVELTPGQMFVLASGIEHDVLAKTDGSFVLTLAWPSKQ